MKKLYLYIRLSDADDDLKFKTESESIANQRTLLYRFIRARREFDGYEVVEFVDDGYSGTNGNRPSFERMIESLKNGEANVVICKDFSRFFRDYVEIGDYLERIFPFLGVRFIAVNDGYDSDDYKGSTAGMEVVMKYIVYSYYSRDLSQKIKTVMSTRKSKGEFVAAQPPYGYMKDPDVKRKIIPNPDTAPVVRKIFDLALEGKTPAEIAVVLNDYKLETPSAYYMRMNPDSKKFRTSSKEACWTVSNGLDQQSDDDQPDPYDGDSVNPFLRFSILPHSLRLLSASFKHRSRNQLHGDHDQGWQQNHIIQIPQNRNEVRDQVNG